MSGQLVALFLPLVVIQITLQLLALRDLIRRDAAQLTGGSKALWAVVILLFNILGPVIYFTVGRKET